MILARKTADKRKSEFKSLSIDEIHEKYSDSAEGLFDIISEHENSEDILLVDYIKSKKDFIHIAILDKVCFSNWSSFRNIINDIKSLDEENFDYYHNKYGVDYEDFTETLKEIRNFSNKRIHREIKKILYLSRKDFNN